jgi:hypothetical protein
VLAPTRICTLEFECGQALHGSRPPAVRARRAVTAGGYGISTAAGHVAEHLPHGELVQTRISNCGESSDDIVLTSPTRGIAVRWRLRSFVVPSSVSRVTAPAVCWSFNAKGRDLLHEVDVPDQVPVPQAVRVCTGTVTACGTCSTFKGKPPKLPMETVLRTRRISDCLRP